jgi:hypothetical protein
MCYEEGRMLAYLDGEVSAEERAEIAAHVGACEGCAGTLERLASDRSVAADALGKLQSAGTVVPMPVPAARPRGPVGSRPAARWPQVAAAAAAVLLLGSFALAPVRGAAASLLQVLRVQKVQTVTLSQTDLQSIASALKTGGHVDLKSFGEAWIDGAASTATTVTLEQAQAAVDFPVKLPTTLSSQPVLLLQEAQEYKFKLHVAAINEALTSYGSDRTLPASLDNQVFSVQIPPIVVARYPAPAGVDTAGLEERLNGVYVGQARSPGLVVPDGVDPAELRAVLLNLPFIPQKVRDQIASVQNWQSTLLIPNVDGSAHDVTINGVSAVVITPDGAARDARKKIAGLPPIGDNTTVIWNDSGVIRAVGGSINEETATGLANSMVK